MKMKYILFVYVLIKSMYIGLILNNVRHMSTQDKFKIYLMQNHQKYFTTYHKEAWDERQSTTKNN